MIKKYLHFIKENKSVESEKFKKIDEYFEDDDILSEFFYELIDDGCIFNIEKGLVYYTSYKRYEWINIFLPTTVNIAYELFFKIKNKKDENVYEILNSSINRITTYFDMNYYLTNDFNEVINNLQDFNHESFHDYFCIVIYENKNTVLNSAQIADYYYWEYDYVDEKGNIYVNLEYNNAIELFIKDDDRYKKYLLNDDLWFDDYWNSNEYRSDNNSLFSYYINKENTEIIIKKIIDSYGGYLKVIEDYIDDIDNEEELIKYYKKNPIELDMIDYNNLLDEIKDIESNYHIQAQIDQNYKDIECDFFNKLKKEFNYKIIENEEKSIIRILFDYKWYNDKNYDKNDLMKFNDITEVLNEYIYDEGIRFYLEPYFKDYGDFDYSNFNIDIAYLVK